MGFDPENEIRVPTVERKEKSWSLEEKSVPAKQWERPRTRQKKRLDCSSLEKYGFFVGLADQKHKSIYSLDVNRRLEDSKLRHRSCSCKLQDQTIQYCN